MHGVLQDVKYALRVLGRTPGFTAVVILTLALGIAANTAIFSVIRGVLLAPLPYREPDRVVRIFGQAQEGGRWSVSVPEYMDYRAQATRFEELTAYTMLNGNLSGGGPPERISFGAARSTFFPLLGVSPLLGRWFSADEEQVGRDQVVVLSHAFWQRRFGGDPTVIGRNIQIDRDAYQVVGVLPERFWFPDKADMWGPLSWRPQDLSEGRRGSHNLRVLGRIKAGSTLVDVRAEMEVIGARLRELHPEHYPPQGRWHPFLIPFHDQVVENVKLHLWMLIGAVALVLLIACANVANLLLARGSARERELAVRAALGARRPRIVRQLLTESLLLSAMGGGLGLLCAVWGIDLLVKLGPSDLPRAGDVRVDSLVLTFTIVVSTVTGLIFGLLPAVMASRVDVHDVLGAGGRSTGGRRPRRLRRALVVAEVALALVLLSGAGFLMRSFSHVLDVDPGFQVDRTTAFRVVRPSPNGPSTPADRARYEQFFEQALERLARIPGVVAAGGITSLPLSSAGNDNSFEVEGVPIPAGAPQPNEQIREVTPGYFEAMNIPVLQGRAVDRTDTNDSPPVVVVNRSFAEKYWKGQDAVGKRMRIFIRDPAPWWTVVGVVGDVREWGLDAAAPPAMYVPHSQDVGASLGIVVRASTDAPLVDAVRAALAEIDPNQPIYDVRTMRERLSRSLDQRRFTLIVLEVFAALALVMAALGLYGVMAHSVAQRTHEIGVRMALGAPRVGVLAMVARESAALVAAGVVLGVAGSLLLARLVSDLFYGIDTGDPTTLLASVGVLAAVAGLASYLPARRAAGVDPMVALRSE